MLAAFSVLTGITTWAFILKMIIGLDGKLLKLYIWLEGMFGSEGWNLERAASKQSACQSDFGARLREVIDDLKQSFKKDEDAEKKIIQDLSRSLGLSVRTIYRIFSGRYSNPTEQKKIAKSLGMSFERLLQLDTVAKKEKIQTAITDKKCLSDALEIAKEITDISIGVTEKFEAYKDLGRVYYEMRQFSDAHNAWKIAYEFAKRINEKEKISSVCSNLMHSAVNSRKFLELEKILNEAIELMDDDPEKSGLIKCFLGVMFCEHEQYSEGLKYFIESFEKYSFTRNAELIGKAQHNIATAYLKMKDYENALHWQEKALDSLSQSDMFVQLLTIDEYAETLLGLGRKGEVVAISERCLSDLEGQCEALHQNLKAKFLLHLSKAKNESVFAEIAATFNADRKTNLKVAEFLHDFFLRQGDAEKALYYHERVLEHKH